MGGGDVGGCSVLDDPEAREQEEVCQGGACVWVDTGNTKDCDDGDGWYGGGDVPGFNDPRAEFRDYYVTSNGTCTYSVCDTVDYDSEDGNYCVGNTREFRDYYVLLSPDPVKEYSVVETEDCKEGYWTCETNTTLVYYRGYCEGGRCVYERAGEKVCPPGTRCVGSECVECVEHEFQVSCDNGVDDDCDGKVDMEDPDCVGKKYLSINISPETDPLLFGISLFLALLIMEKVRRGSRG